MSPQRDQPIPTPTTAAPVAVIGSTGFVGAAIARALRARRASVIPLSRRECDLLGKDAAVGLEERLPAGAHVVFCSAITRVVRDSYDTLLQNIQMVETFAMAARRRRPSSVIYLSTTDVYGYTPPVPISEATIAAPESYYALSKLTGERLLYVNGGMGCPVSILRLPGIYGPGDGERSVVGRLTQRLRCDGGVTIYGRGCVRRDYVEVGDICNVVAALLETPYHGMLNIATGTSIAIEDLVQLIARHIGILPMIERAPAEPMRAADQVFDVAALRRYAPHLRMKPVGEGIIDYVQSASRPVTT